MRKSQSCEGCDRTGPSSRYEVGVLQPLLHCAQEKRWVTTDLGSASFEPCTSQAAVQDDDAETHFRVRPSPRLVPSTLKVYVAAISAHHDPIEGRSVGKHDLVVRFLRGARRLNPPRPPSLPSWDLALVLRALQIALFEPLLSVELKFLSMKTLLLTALASIKRVGDLQAFSVDESCLEFGPADSSATLRPRPGYVPKVPTTPFRDQVVNLQALPLEEADPALALLCPVHALRQYVDRTQSFRTSEQLLFVTEGSRRGMLSPSRGWPTG